MACGGGIQAGHARPLMCPWCVHAGVSMQYQGTVCKGAHDSSVHRVYISAWPAGLMMVEPCSVCLPAPWLTAILRCAALCRLSCRGRCRGASRRRATLSSCWARWAEVAAEAAQPSLQPEAGPAATGWRRSHGQSARRWAAAGRRWQLAAVRAVLGHIAASQAAAAHTVLLHQHAVHKRMREASPEG
jgi:hypothetical protein